MPHLTWTKRSFSGGELNPLNLNKVSISHGSFSSFPRIIPLFKSYSSSNWFSYSSTEYTCLSWFKPAQKCATFDFFFVGGRRKSSTCFWQPRTDDTIGGRIESS